MTGNVALDVVIGLVFVYLLYSLYATILMELISSVFGLRALNLKYTLKRMLAQEKIPSKRWNWLEKFGTTLLRSGGFAPNLTDMKLYEEFMKQPNIKYLGSGGIGGKPSYLTAENFSKGLIDSIRDNDADLSLMADIEIGLTKKPIVAPETRMHIETLMRDANYDPVKFKILLENWFNDTMDRSTGWFKQTTQTIVLLIGFVLTISFNVDTIAIIKKLSTDKDARDQMVKLATDFTDKKKDATANTINYKTDSLEQKRADSIRAEELKQIKQSLEVEIANSQSVLQSSWHLPGSVVYHSVLVPKDSVGQVSIHKDSMRLLLGDTGFVILHKSVDSVRIKKQIERKKKILNSISDGETIPLNPFWYKLGYVFCGGRFWGYLLTVLALSLGAPFWFDMLNKLVKLRTGKQVDEAGSLAEKKTINKDTLNRVG